ncbi:BTAD domain-containing putative transcriptional regulator [Micromonospora sp. WMMD1155]|uniref:BTAD domain-containing putative transcriptional regulator n=1 Tax=Micromonospora sp. WMMD1155 TaxID=3016094 RepID=UPI00249A3C57|nr:BTAD domain-containing putative transcriptional regulator [Micromonospora sp. WMMD1155]WFE54477.1 BTAD domain-containing putative transcriptional regulator [Micromonospora sp. WMMD1155]
MHPLRAGRQRGVCCVVAAAGYGKTTALRRWFPRTDGRWCRGDEGPVRQLVADAVAAGDRLVVVDDLPPTSAEQLHLLLHEVGRWGDDVTVVLASRWPLSAPATRLLGSGLWTELGPADLALSPQGVADLIAEEYGLSTPDLADRVYAATGGWPALVHLSAETLRLGGVPSGPLAPILSEPGGPIARYIADEVLAALPAEASRLLRQVGALTPVSVGLCRALGHRGAARVVDGLRRTGLLTRQAWAAAGPGAPTPEDHLVPIVVETARHGHRAPTTDQVRHTAAAAAAWYDEHGPPVAAAREYLRAGDHPAGARVLDAHGDRMIAAGRSPAVIELVRMLPERLRTRRLRLLLGDALRTLGDLGAATREYDAVAEESWDAGLAWRLGRIHYQRGDARAALAILGRPLARSAPPADRALLLAWTAHAHLLAGDTETATGYARQALAAATSAGQDDVLATTHLSVALCLSVAGDRAGSEEHFALALPIAERTGDVLLLTRIHTNRTHQFLRTGRFAEALTMAERSARYAALAGAPSLRAIATSNEADALAMLGRYDEAVQRYQAALAFYQQKGSRRFIHALLGLGELYRRRGWREQARAAYEETIRVTEETGNAHVLVPALAGLALVRLDDDVPAAAQLADRAARDVADEIVVPALLAQGWVALRTAAPDRATTLAGEAARIARGQGDLAGLADALELRAAAEQDLGRAREALREGCVIWNRAGAAVEAARLLVVLGRLPGADIDDRLAGLLAGEQVALAGAQVDRTASSSGEWAPGTGPIYQRVVIRALGRFEVHLDGRPVPASQWQSRKARDLVRILVARRGRPVPRSELCELLWPDDDPDRTGHRLSVLLSIVRGVLDPTKTFAPDHFLVADQACIGLDVSRLRVDVEEFLAHVAHARRLVERGALAEGRTVLLAADRQYRADAFEDEPYADWSGPLREEARAAYLSLLRMLAQVSRATAGPAAAVTYLLRLLERDPYDQPAHRALVRTLAAGGQHGEARRALARYREAMSAIGVHPPDEIILAPGRPGRQPQAADHRGSPAAADHRRARAADRRR